MPVNAAVKCAALSAAFAAATLAAAAQGPCDITAAAGNRCVAAHSTVRALYAGYDGPLYNVTRSSDGKSANIGVLEKGGFANIATHDAVSFVELHYAVLKCTARIRGACGKKDTHVHDHHQPLSVSLPIPIPIHQFCAKGDCVISNVFDQSPNGNHLGQRHKLVNASRHKILVGNNVPV